MLIALFFLLVRGDELVKWLDRVSPLRPGQTGERLTTFKRVSFAVIASAGVTAAVQAVAALVGFLIAQAIGAAIVSLLAAPILLVT